jgi:hypothetical protein
MAVDPSKEPTLIVSGRRIAHGAATGGVRGRLVLHSGNPRSAVRDRANEVGSAALGKAAFDVEFIAFRVCHGDPAGAVGSPVVRDKRCP